MCFSLVTYFSDDKPRISMPCHNNRSRITKDFRSATCTRDESQHCVIRRVAISPPPALCRTRLHQQGVFLLIVAPQNLRNPCLCDRVGGPLTSAEIRPTKCHVATSDGFLVFLTSFSRLKAAF